MITYISGDLFSHQAKSPDYTIVYAHACNCQGSWGAGVAAVFKRRFPEAYGVYKKHCEKSESRALLGTSLVIPAFLDAGKVYVACLFTSNFSGKRKLGPGDIVQWTDLAMSDLVQQLDELRANGSNIEEEAGLSVVNMPKINAGLFAVPWEETEAVLERHRAVLVNVYVIERESRERERGE